MNGEWSNWGSWSPCQLAPGLTAQGLKCGIGTQKRVRHCSNPTPVNNGQFCPGESVQVTECTILCPPIDGFWSPWSQWSICSHECTQVEKIKLKLSFFLIIVINYSLGSKKNL